MGGIVGCFSYFDISSGIVFFCCCNFTFLINFKSDPIQTILNDLVKQLDSKKGGILLRSSVRHLGVETKTLRNSSSICWYLKKNVGSRTGE